MLPDSVFELNQIYRSNPPGFSVRIDRNTHQSTKNENKEENDPLLVSFFRRATESNLLIREMLGHVFDKNRSSLKAYDHSSTIHAIEKTVHFHMQENELV